MKHTLTLAAAFAVASLFADIKMDKPDWVHIGAGAEALTAYQLYGAMFNDEPAVIYTSSVDFDIPSVGTIGVGTWTLSDITKRCDDLHSRWNNETDFDIHFYGGFDIAEEWQFDYYVGYIWMVMYHSQGNAPTQHSGIWGFEIANPYVTPFVNFEYQHAYNASLYTESGFKRSFEVCDTVTLTPSISLSTMGSRFKRSFFPECEGGYSNGIEALFARLKAEWKVTEWFTAYSQIVYCSILDNDIRNAIRSCDDTTYKTDFATLEVGVSFEF